MFTWILGLWNFEELLKSDGFYSNLYIALDLLSFCLPLRRILSCDQVSFLTFDWPTSYWLILSCNCLCHGWFITQCLVTSCTMPIDFMTAFSPFINCLLTSNHPCDFLFLFHNFKHCALWLLISYFKIYSDSYFTCDGFGLPEWETELFK